MKAMALFRTAPLAEVPNPLQMVDLPIPQPQGQEILIRVSACGVCHTELDEIEGRTAPSRFPIILGHQIVGRVEKIGPGAGRFQVGDRVGVGWIYRACGTCRFCRRGDENLCGHFMATGRDAQGGYAEFMTVGEAFAFPIPDFFSDLEAAPLLCAGAIGYRSLRLAGMEDGKTLGLIGFGASAHLVLQIARHQFPNSKIAVFARSPAEQEFARELGASWAGGMEEDPPESLDCAIDTTPVWGPVVEGLKKLSRGGRLVINAIRKEEIDKDILRTIDYPRHLWLEKEIKTVANVARRDIGEFLHAAAKIPIRPQVQVFPLEGANHALWELKNRKIRGAKVLKIESGKERGNSNR